MRNSARDDGLLNHHNGQTTARMEPSMARRDAWCWALLAFVLTIGRGLFLSVGFEATVQAALLSLIAGYGLGLLCGVLWQEAFK